MILDHAHGVATQKCDHPDCKAAMTRYRKRWVYERSHGHTRTTDPAEVAMHVATLNGQGWSARAIAGAAGVAPQSITRLLRGEAKVISRRIAAKILAISPDTIPSSPSKQTTEPFVPRIGTVRRLQALQAIGWSSTALRQFGIDKDNLLNQQGRWVTRSTHDRVADVYRVLCTKPGPSPHSRGRALKLGYLPPVVWNNIDLDVEPEPEPDETDELPAVLEQLDERCPGCERILVPQGTWFTLTNEERKAAKATHCRRHTRDSCNACVQTARKVAS